MCSLNVCLTSTERCVIPSCLFVLHRGSGETQFRCSVYRWMTRKSLLSLKVNLYDYPWSCDANKNNLITLNEIELDTEIQVKDGSD